MRMTTDDNELAFRAAAADRQAFRVLLERHYDRIYRLALRYFGDVAEAEDVTQDICVSLAAKLKSFRGDARFSTWLYRLVINRCRDQSRRKTRAKAFINEYAEVSALLAADVQHSRQHISWLYDALDHLSADLRETAILVLAEDQTHAQAAEVLGIKEATVSWRMHEIRKQLKALATAGDGGLNDR